MAGSHSAIYSGWVTHNRLRPKAHRLRYSVFFVLLDLNEVDALARRLRFWSHNRLNLFSFYDRDHGDRGSQPLRERIEQHLKEAGLEYGGSIQLLTMPRMLGYAFNPLSVYFCHRRDASLSAIFYEVNNTFGQRHNYLIAVPVGAKGVIRQESQKSFYVSPFMTTAMTYSFKVTPPGDNVAVSIVGGDDDGPLIYANLFAVRRDLNDSMLARLFCVYPLMTIKVIAGIHWEALRIWLKGIRLRPRPAPPVQPVTLGRDARTGVERSGEIRANEN